MGVVLGKHRGGKGGGDRGGEVGVGRSGVGARKAKKALHQRVVRRQLKRIEKAMCKDDTARTPGGLPLPPKVHAVLCSEDGYHHQTRVIIVGDVHGCCDELEVLLKNLEFDEDSDLVVLAGDVVNKGPKSVETVRKARAIRALGVRGNHDDAALKHYHAWRAGEDIPVKWDWVKEMSEEDALYLHALPFTAALPHHNVVVVHAGLVPGVNLEHQDLGDMMEMRELLPLPLPEGASAAEGGEAAVAAAAQWEAVSSSCKGSTGWAEQWPGPINVVFGHDAKRHLQRRRFATGLDTGCVYGLGLTALVLPPLCDLDLDPHLNPAHVVGQLHYQEALDTYAEPNALQLHDLTSAFDNVTYYRVEQEDALCLGDEKGYASCTPMVHLSGKHRRDILPPEERTDEVETADEGLARV